MAPVPSVYQVFLMTTSHRVTPERYLKNAQGLFSAALGTMLKGHRGRVPSFVACASWPSEATLR